MTKIEKSDGTTLDDPKDTRGNVLKNVSHAADAPQNRQPGHVPFLATAGVDHPADVREGDNEPPEKADTETVETRGKGDGKGSHPQEVAADTVPDEKVEHGITTSENF